MGLRGGIYLAKATRLAAILVILFAGLSVFAFSTTYTPLRMPPRALTTAASVELPNLTRQGLVLPMGLAPAPDSLQVGHPSVLSDGGTYQMWYFEVDASYYCQIAYATSLDGRLWTKHGAVLWPTVPQEGHNTAYPSVVRVGGMYWMFYDGTPTIDGSDYQIFAATSPDGANWTKLGIVLGLGPAGSPDSVSLLYPHALVVSGTFYLWYTGLTSLTPPGNGAIMLAKSTNGLNWTKQGVVLTNGTAGSLDSYNAVAGSVALDGSTFVMVYDGETAYLTSNLLYAVSDDGVHWTKRGLALARDPPAETYLAQPDLVVLRDGQWNVYYVVRNDTSDLQIYLATGVLTTPPGTVPANPTPSVVATILAFVPPPLFLALATALGAVAGGGLGYVHERLRHRGTR